MKKTNQVLSYTSALQLYLLVGLMMMVIVIIMMIMTTMMMTTAMVILITRVMMGNYGE